MSLLKKALAVLAVAVLSGCATAPPPPMQSRIALETHAIVQTPLFDRTDNNTALLDTEKTQVYSQNFGGGGAGLGILLGPIGVAANMAMIADLTKADAGKLTNKINLKSRDIFAQAAKENAFPLVDAKQGTPGRLTPYLLVTKTDSEVLTLAVGMLIEQGEGATLWRGKYLYQLPGKYTVEKLAALDEAQTSQIRAAMATAFSRLIVQLKADNPEHVSSEQKIHMTSPWLTPRIEIELLGSLIKEEGEHVWVRTSTGLYVVLKDSIRYTIPKV